jgi:hypothetical protein
MVLIGIYGGLGKGKSLALAYMCWNNLFIKNREIYSNFTLYGIPHTRITTLKGLLKIIPLKTSKKEIMEGKEIFFAGDELWRWVSSRCIGKGSKERKEVIDRILLASRKAFVTIVYTVQTPKQIDTWIRDTTDLWVLPFLQNNILTLYWLDFPKLNPTFGDLAKHMASKPRRVVAEPFYAIYNTYERIPMIDEEEDKFEKKIIPIFENPAWRRYWLVERKVSEERFLKICKEVEKRFWLYNADGIQEKPQPKALKK